MDLAATINSIAAKGAMFWAATGSVALGGTLILVAVVAQLRGLRRKRGRIPAATESSVPAPVEQATGTESSPEIQETPAAEAEAVLAGFRGLTRTDDRELRQLLVRLRSVADKLEENSRRAGEKSAPTGESPLKDTESPVDYVFRAGLG